MSNSASTENKREKQRRSAERQPFEMPVCGEKRSPSSKITCELPVIHPEEWKDWHIGRGRAGQWFSWAVSE